MDDNMRKLFEVIHELEKRIEDLEKQCNHNDFRINNLVETLRGAFKL